MKTRILASNGSVLFKGSDSALAIWKQNKVLPGDAVVEEVANGKSFSDLDVSAASSYFLVRGEIKLQRADTRMEALVKRASPGQLGPVNVMWEREL